MFVPSPSTAKGKIAFIPESLHLTYFSDAIDTNTLSGRTSISDGVPVWQIAVYWQEVKKGNPITVLGVATIYFIETSLSTPTFNKTFPNRKHEDITYEDLIAVTTYKDIRKEGAVKLGHVAPYFRPDSYKSPIYESNLEILNFYDAKRLAYLHANPTALPSDAEGWYKINPKDS